MLKIEETTVICPKNDLESHVIAKIAQKLNIDVRLSSQKWGARLGLEPQDTFKGLKKNIVIIEMPDPEKEKALRHNGYEVIPIDHHQYFSEDKTIDRSQSLSSLEQFAELFNYTLDQYEKLVALNDKGYIWEMAKKSNCSLEDMKSIRTDDLKAQGFNDKMLSISEDDYGRKVDFSNFTLVTTSLDKISYIAQLHQMPKNQDVLDKYRKSIKENNIEDDLKVNNILILTLSQNKENVVEINFFGDVKLKNKFFDILSELNSDRKKIDIWESSHCEKSFYWGARRCSTEGVDDLADAVLGRLLENDRLLLQYSTFFLYPFKINNKMPYKASKYWKNTTFKYNNEDDKKYQEYIYFHPYARKSIFQTTDSLNNSEAVLHYEFKSLLKNSFLEICLANEKTINYPITHLSIHEFFNDIAILTIQVTKNIGSKLMKEKKLWKQCMRFADFRNKHLTCEDAMTFNELARKIYLSFPEQFDECMIPKQIKMSIEGIQEDKFKHTFNPDDFKFKSKSPIKPGWPLENPPPVAGSKSPT